VEYPEYILTLISTPASHDNSNYFLLHSKDFTTVRITPTLTSTHKMSRYTGVKTKKERKKKENVRTDLPHINTNKMCSHKTCHCAGVPGYYVDTQFHCIVELNTVKPA
jgi:hypothetical protein